MKLTDSATNTELESMDCDGSICVYVEDTARNVTGSIACCQDTGCFSDTADTPLTDEQQDWLESQEVMDWLDEVGY